MGVEYSLSSPEVFIGYVAISSSPSFIRNMRVISAMAFFFKCRSAVIEEKSFEWKQLIWLKVETMSEDLVKIWRIFLWKISQVLVFVELRGWLWLRPLG